MCLMCIIYAVVNTFGYYKYKAFKRRQRDVTLTKMFALDSKASSYIINSRNLAKIIFLNTVAVIGLVDTAFDIVFVAVCYGSGVVWLAIVVGIAYIYTFFDKFHSTRKLIVLVKELRTKRFESNLLKDHQKQIQFYSSCASISAYPLAETLGSYNLRSINLLRRVLLFEGAHIAV